MDLVLIILLLVIGVALVEIEIVFIPGTTFVGIIGFIISSIGVYLTFHHYGKPIGFLIMGIYLTILIVSIVLGFKSGVWNRFALKTSIESKVNEEQKRDIQIGMRGKAFSTLRPIGMAEINDQVIEVQARDGYIEAGSEIEVIQIKPEITIVKLIN